MRASVARAARCEAARAGSNAFWPRRPRPGPARSRGAGARALARAGGGRGGGAAAQGGRDLDLLRGPAHRQRPPRAPPRVGPGVQGPVPPLPDDARPRRPPQGRLGLPRPAGGARGREGARARDQGRHRGLRHRGVQPALPRIRAALRGGLVGADGALGRMDRHRRRLLDAGQRLHRVGLVDHAPALGQGAALRGAPGHPLLRPVRHRAQLARGGAGLRGRRRSVHLRPLPPGGRARGGGRARCRPPGVDHHALDPDLQRGGGRRSRLHLRARGRPRRRARPGAGRARRGAPVPRGRGARALARRRPRGLALPAPLRLHRAAPRAGRLAGRGGPPTGPRPPVRPRAPRPPRGAGPHARRPPGGTAGGSASPSP